MSANAFDDDVLASLRRLHGIESGRTVPASLASALRALPVTAESDRIERLMAVADSRHSADRGNTRGPTLTHSHLVTFSSATFDVAIDVFPDEERRLAELRGVVLCVSDLGPVDLSIGSHTIACDADGSFRLVDQPFGDVAVAVVDRQPPFPTLAQFTLIVD